MRTCREPGQARCFSGLLQVEKTYGFPLTQRDTDDIAILLRPLSNLLDMAVVHLNVVVRRRKTESMQMGSQQKDFL